MISETGQGPRVRISSASVQISGSSGAQILDDASPKTRLVDIRRGHPGELSKMDQILDYLKALTR